MYEMYTLKLIASQRPHLWLPSHWRLRILTLELGGSRSSITLQSSLNPHWVFPFLPWAPTNLSSKPVLYMNAYSVAFSVYCSDFNMGFPARKLGMDKLKMSKMKAQIAAVLVSLHPNSTLHHCLSSGAIALWIVFNDGWILLSLPLCWTFCISGILLL